MELALAEYRRGFNTRHSLEMKLKCDLDNLTSVVFIFFTNVYSKEIGIDKQQQQQQTALVPRVIRESLF